MTFPSLFSFTWNCLAKIARRLPSFWARLCAARCAIYRSPCRPGSKGAAKALTPPPPAGRIPECPFFFFSLRPRCAIYREEAPPSGERAKIVDRLLPAGPPLSSELHNAIQPRTSFPPSFFFILFFLGFGLHSHAERLLWHQALREWKHRIFPPASDLL